MPCKHEGGADPCDFYPSAKARNCKTYFKLYRAKNRKPARRYAKRWRKNNPKYNKRSFSNSPATKGDAGQAGELLVASDFLSRGYSVTKPLNTNGAHDLHVRIGTVWFGVQVKLGMKSKTTGTLYLVREAKNNIQSPIIAIVFLPTKEIRFVGNPTLPVELK